MAIITFNRMSEILLTSVRCRKFLERIRDDLIYHFLSSAYL